MANEITEMKVHGRWIDTKGWNHPGGSFALSYGLGRDATTLFEMHHPFFARDKLKGILKKLEISDPKRIIQLEDACAAEDADGAEVFDWPGGLDKMSAYRTDLVKEVGNYFEAEAKRKGITVREAIKATYGWWIERVVYLVLAVAIYVFWTLPTGSYLSVFALVPFAWLATGSMLHEGSHFALSAKPWVNRFGTHCAPWLAPAWSWVVQHVVGHHAHTNVVNRDPDLYHAPQNWRYHPAVKWSPSHSNQTMTFWLIWALSTISTSFLNELDGGGRYNTVVSFPRYCFWQLFMGLRFSAMFAVLFVLPHFTMPTHGAAVLIPLMIWTGLSFTFMCFSQVSHLDHESICVHIKEDFFKHQTESAQDYAVDSRFWNIASIGLNCQAVHHLFPTIGYSHYPQVQPIIQAVAERHNVNYKVFPDWWTVFCRYYQQLVFLRVDPEQAAQEKSPGCEKTTSQIVVDMLAIVNPYHNFRKSL